MGIWYDKKAYELLKKCSDAKDLTEWNEYRKATNYSPINLRFANLSNFYLQKAELQYIDFRGSNFKNTDFKLADVNKANISIQIYKILYLMGFIIVGINIYLFFSNNILGIQLHNDDKLLILISVLGVFSALFSIISGAIIVFSIEGIWGSLVAGTFQGILFGGIISIFSNYIDFNVFIFLLCLIGILFAYKFDSDIISKWENLPKALASAKNPDKVIGFDTKYLEKINSIVNELQEESSGLSKAIETTQDDYKKQKLLIKQEKLEEKIQFYLEQEKSARHQKTQVENVISELQSPYKYIHQTIGKIEWHNRFYYGGIVVFIGIFIYAIAHGYVDQKMATFSSLFTKETLPSFGTIFGVILFFGSPVLIGISLIIYFIAQINKNIDKITELQEQERNIKQIASAIKAKAQVGMSDEEFVKETKNLIQKYQEGMMAGMFSKEKTSDKEEKSSAVIYREKLIANGMAKLLMQTLKK
ncbi:MAG: pentapeptide repeat-containing protein [Sulfuricurvum sp.]|jgi:hypothetical protein|uniref:pentapeptide repeat-containing protein n=1 Tax=Sulfuricurvum sp. TaxID=2025608 RepID=UPI0025EA8AF7|nr:pentapeptide repeat-containing protein [Sulfuricurvum sp.]MCK9374183.1 pentapeptide repeat-containing protein [Sulfuricurvum sp.]